jgi:antitoxin VapB
MKTAKLFMNGRSQAVRLPREFRFLGKEVWIRREGSCVILEPVRDAWDEAFWASFGGWDEEIARLGGVESLRDPFE